MTLAEELGDRIGIINEGSLIASGTMNELRETAKGDNRRLEDIFLRLTGGEELDEVREVL